MQSFPQLCWKNATAPRLARNPAAKAGNAEIRGRPAGRSRERRRELVAFRAPGVSLQRAPSGRYRGLPSWHVGCSLPRASAETGGGGFVDSRREPNLEWPSRRRGQVSCCHRDTSAQRPSRSGGWWNMSAKKILLLENDDFYVEVIGTFVKLFLQHQL